MTEDLPTTYRQAGFEGSFRLGTRPVVLVVDLSRGFTDPECPLGSDLDAVVEANVRLLAAARAHDVPAIFSTIAFTDAEADGGVWLQKVPTLATLKVGSPWTEIDPRLGVRSDEVVITKRFASAFFGSHLPAVLATLHADTVIITGATTSGCVRASGVDSMQYGYPTLIVRECVGDRHDGPHEANLFDLDAKYADVVTLRNVLDYIEALPPRGA